MKHSHVFKLRFTFYVVVIFCLTGDDRPLGAQTPGPAKSSVNNSASWPRFRGPNGSGVSDATNIPIDWTDDDYHWMTKLPGTGHSSPVVWGDRLWLTSADEKTSKRHLLCIDTGSGKILWKKTQALMPHKKHRNNTHASGTAALDHEHVYVVWQSSLSSSLTATTHQGEEVWKYELGPYKGKHGSGVSPIVFEDKVILCNDHEGESFLLALDRKTGKVRWKVKRSGRRACYATPCIYRPAGRQAEIIFSHSYQGIWGVDPQTGDRNWKIDVFGTFKQRACGSPIVSGDLIIAASGFTTGERNLVVMRPTGKGTDRQEGKKGGVEEIYRISRGAPHVPTPLVHGDRLYLWSDRGIVTCADRTTGKIIWQRRAGGNYFGSPVWVDGRLYCISKLGIVFVVDASDQYKLLARNPLGQPSAATPAVAAGRMYLRTNSLLFSIGGK